MDPQKIERINELARLKKQRPLTDEELAEREALRREYIDAYRENMRAVLEGVRVKMPDGTLKPLQKKADKR